MPNNKSILLTIDVEDWFQVENFKPWIPRDSWNSRQLRVEQNTCRLLDLFDELSATSGDTGRCGKWKEQKKTNIEHRTSNVEHRMKTKNQNLNKLNEPGVSPLAHSLKPTACSPSPSVRATFFVLGWIARRLPHLVREIHARGHEVASHGMDHDLCNRVSTDDLSKDLIDSRKLLEDTIGNAIYGYRAPSFSVDDRILKIIAECGYLYDSSYNSFGLHGRYGQVNMPANGNGHVAARVTNGFYELPVSNLKINSNGRVFPWGGGAYFRLMPFPIFRRGIQTILQKDDAYVFYMHPWEIAPDQPRVSQAAPSLKFRHYVNQAKTYKRLQRMIQNFSRCRFVSCREYLEGSATERQQEGL